MSNKAKRFILAVNLLFTLVLSAGCDDVVSAIKETVDYSNTKPACALVVVNSGQCDK